jgi:hypothetical protein
MNKELQNNEAETVKASPENARARKSYRKPAFQYERVYETMALACGKQYSTESQCRFNRKAS